MFCSRGRVSVAREGFDVGCSSMEASGESRVYIRGAPKAPQVMAPITSPPTNNKRGPAKARCVT